MRRSIRLSTCERKAAHMAMKMNSLVYSLVGLAVLLFGAVVHGQARSASAGQTPAPEVKAVPFAPCLICNSVSTIVAIVPTVTETRSTYALRIAH
jgi:hypothetical protein